ncbi:MAG: acylneuraminate cytidylyltransferase family protein [Anaerolineaceae bacterium]
MKIEKIVALVPMRHHSQRVPEKNFRLLAGKPLYRHIMDTLLACPEITLIAVDTDSPVIMEGLRTDYPQVKVIERPEHLRAPEIPMNEVLMHDTGLIPADLYFQTHSTNPMLRSQSISAALQKLVGLYPAYDSLFSVTKFQRRLWDGLARPVNHNPAILLQTQDLPPLYEENSCMYMFTRTTLETKRNRLGDRPYLFEIDATEAWDIDDEEDFYITDLMLSHRKKQNR